MRGVAGDGTWDRLPGRARAFLAGEGDGAYVDAGLHGLEPSGLGRIRVPATILTGDASDPFYRPIAEALTGRIPGARHAHLPGMTHASPISDPAAIVGAALAAFAAAGIVRPGSSDSVIEESHA